MFSCMAHSRDPGQYVALEFENGALKNRTLYRGAERKSLESLARSGDFTTVYADRRTDSKLLPFSFSSDAVQADLNVFRRAKSDEEIHALTRMATLLRASHDHARSTEHFRGVAEKMEFEHGASEERRGDDLTLRRYGLKDAYGRSVELSSIVPHTEEWRGRVERIHRGCDAVVAMIAEGVSGDAVDAAFRGHLDPKLDVIYGGVLHHTGYEPWERSLDVDVLRRYDVYTVCPIVGDHAGTWAPLMHSVHAVGDGATTYRGDVGAEDFESLFRASGIDDFLQTLDEQDSNIHSIVDIKRIYDGISFEQLSQALDQTNGTNTPNGMYALFSRVIIGLARDEIIPKENVFVKLYIVGYIRFIQERQSANMLLFPSRDDLETEICSRFDIASQFSDHIAEVLASEEERDDLFQYIRDHTDPLLKEDSGPFESSLHLLNREEVLMNAFNSDEDNRVLDGSFLYESNATIWTQVTVFQKNKNPIQLTRNPIHRSLSDETLETFQGAVYPSPGGNISRRLGLDSMIPADFVYGVPYTRTEAEEVSNAWVDKLREGFIEIFQNDDTLDPMQMIRVMREVWVLHNLPSGRFQASTRMYRVVMTTDEVKKWYGMTNLNQNFLTTVLPVKVKDNTYSLEIVGPTRGESVPTISIAVSMEQMETFNDKSTIDLEDCGIPFPLILPHDTVVHLFVEEALYGRMMMTKHMRVYCGVTNASPNNDTVKDVAQMTVTSLKLLNEALMTEEAPHHDASVQRRMLLALTDIQKSVLRLMHNVFIRSTYQMRQEVAVRILCVISHVISKKLCDALRNDPKRLSGGYYHIDPAVATLTSSCGRVSAIGGGVAGNEVQDLRNEKIPKTTGSGSLQAKYDEMMPELRKWYRKI